MNPVCEYHGGELDPNDPSVYRQITGWERTAGTRASGKHGGSDITLRFPTGLFACATCVARLKAGVSVHQESLL